MSSEDPEKETSISKSEFDPGQYFSRHWREVLQILVVLAFGYAALRGLAQTLINVQVPTAAKYRVEAGGKDSEVRIVGWIEQDFAILRMPLNVHYSFFNLSQNPVRLRFELFEAPGFTRPPYLRLPARDRAFPVYLNGSLAPISSRGAVVTLPAGGTSRARVEVVPYWRTGSSMITSIFGWESSSRVQRHEAFELGPVRRTSPGLQFVSNTLDTGTSLVQTFALPLIIALLGLLLQQVHQSNVHERQAWASMLPVSHKNNGELYVPLLSNILSFRDSLGELQAAAAAKDEEDQARALPEAFFFLLVCLRSMREVNDKGWYLMDRQGEQLVGKCWELFAGRILEELRPYKELSAVIDIVAKKETFSRFQRKLQRLELGDQVRTLEKKFERWATGKDASDLELLLLLRVLLHYEINRIYKFWYGSGPGFPFKECGRRLKAIERRYPDLVKEIRTYAKDFPALKEEE